MKKTLVLLVLLVFSGVLWSNRDELTWLFHQHRARHVMNLKFEIYKNKHLEIHFVPGLYLSRNLSKIATNLTRDLEQAEHNLGIRMSSPLKIYLYNDWEEKGNHVKEVSIAQADADRNILYCIVNEDFDGTKEKLQYQLLLRTKYGHGVSQLWERDVAAGLAGVWNQKALQDWKSFFLSRNLTPDLPSAWKEPDRFSEYLIHGWNAIFVKYLHDSYGMDAVVRLYKTGNPPADYQNKWQHYLTAVTYPKPQLRPFQAEFQRGICYACSNTYDSSYATKKSDASLAELQKSHVQWIAAIPYGFMRSPDSPIIRFAGNHIASESDESLVALSKRLKHRGLKMMLKPQIWIGHDSWPGNIHFETQDEWNEWFANYEEWIIHYAILAEHIDAGVFCIGTELVQTTLAHPNSWEKIIERIRKVYSGPLVYAANHGKEFEELTFWDKLDYIGVDNYYAVRSTSGDGLSEMKKGFQLQKQKIQRIFERYRKPVVFTEIGYMANVAAGMGSLEYNYSKYDEQRQAECYRLAFETYWNEPWFSGMYFWKWFSDPDDRGKNADQHSPHGRPAGLIMAEWYNKPRGQPVK